MKDPALNWIPVLAVAAFILIFFAATCWKHRHELAALGLATAWRIKGIANALSAFIPWRTR